VRWLRLHAPLWIKLTVPIVVTISVVNVFMGFWLASQAAAGVEMSGNQTAATMAAGIEAIFTNDPTDLLQLDSYMEGLLKSQPGVVSARVYGLRNGLPVVASGNPKEIGVSGILDAHDQQLVESGRSGQDRIETSSGTVIETFRPLRQDGALVGAVAIELNNIQETTAIFWTSVGVAVATLIAIVAQLLAAGLVVYLAILRTTRRIGDAVEAVGRGDTSVRLAEGKEPHGRDEIVNLARSVDQMITSVDERERGDALIRMLGQRALERTDPIRLVADGLAATREALGLEVCLFADVDENGSIVNSINSSGVMVSHFGLPIWVGALTRVAVSARRPVLTDVLGQDSRFADPADESEPQAAIIPLARGATGGEAIVAIAPPGRTIASGGLAVLEAVAATIADALHLQEAEEAMAETASKTKAMSSVSHEMRNPLNSILGFTALVLGSDGETLTEKQRRQLGFVQTSATNMLALVNGYLDLAKSRSGSLAVQFESANLAPIVDEVVGSLQPMAGAKQVTIRSSVSAEATARIDVTRVRQILTNLVSNAVKFTPEGGSVYVRARADDHGCRLAVSDTGVGIPRDQKSLVFTEFAKIDAGSLAAGKGTGLGLALTRAFVEAMGGTIRFYSRRGRGTTFVVALPRVELSAPKAVAA